MRGPEKLIGSFLFSGEACGKEHFHGECWVEVLPLPLGIILACYAFSFSTQSSFSSIKMVVLGVECVPLGSCPRCNRELKGRGTVVKQNESLF